MQSLLWPEVPGLFTSNFGVAAYDPDDSGEVSIHVVLGGVSKVEIDENNVL